MQMEEFSVTKDASNLKCPSYTALLMSSAKSPGKVATDSAQELPISGNDSAASALSEQTPSKHLDLASTDCNTRKRKAHSMTKEAAENDEKKGCYNADEDIKEKDSTNVDGKGRNSSDSAESCPKQAPDKKTPAPPPKQDYIHVRARRGQATDSHSLAERVRREKISERMRILQELVPGCNKITGKAVMLDEIINYVQSLQRQVEFLSMKLAAVNPLPDFHMDEVSLPKDIWQPYCTSAMPVPDKMIASIQHQQPQSLALEHDMQCKPDEHSISEASVQKMIDPQFHCINGPSDLIYQNMQVSHIWDNELENGVNPRLYNPTKSTHMTSQGFQGHMKVEL